MSREFFRRYPHRDVGESYRWRVAMDRYTEGTHRSAHRLPRLGSVVVGCLQIAAVGLVCGLVTSCILAYLLMLALAK